MLSGTVLAGDPDPGYKYQFAGPFGIDIAVTLTKASNGQFTVGGNKGGWVFSGTMRKNKSGKYVLAAKFRKPGSDNEGMTLDGHWDPEANTLVIDQFSGSRTQGGQDCRKVSLFDDVWVAGRNEMTLHVSDDGKVSGSTTYQNGKIEGIVKNGVLEYTLTMENGWVSRYHMTLDTPKSLFGYSIGIAPDSRKGVKESASFELKK